MHTPSDAGWLGRNFRRLLLAVFPAACAIYVLSWAHMSLPYDWTPGDIMGTVLVAALFLVVPVGVVGGTFLVVVATLTGLLARAGLPLLCASVVAGGMIVLVGVPADPFEPLALWCAVAAALSLGLWAEVDGG